jgi:hypothetical protein
MQHNFDMLIAKEFGVNIAIFLNHLAFWIQKNQANKKHLHDGRYWTYNSVEAFSQLFPYWTPKQMRLVLEKVKKSGLVLVGNYNLTPYDRTQWYALSDAGHELLGIPICPGGQIDLGVRANGIERKGKPIPDIKPDIKQDKIKSICATESIAHDRFDEFWSVYPRKKDKARAKKIWSSQKLDSIAHEIIADVKNRILNDQGWKDIQFIPHALTYLKYKRWSDEVTLKAVSSGSPPNKFNPLEFAIKQVIRTQNAKREPQS